MKSTGTSEHAARRIKQASLASINRLVERTLPRACATHNTYDEASDLFLVAGEEELVPVLHEVTVEGVTTKEPLVVSWPETSPRVQFHLRGAA